MRNRFLTDEYRHLCVRAHLDNRSMTHGTGRHNRDFGLLFSKTFLQVSVRGDIRKEHARLFQIFLARINKRRKFRLRIRDKRACVGTGTRTPFIALQESADISAADNDAPVFCIGTHADETISHVMVVSSGIFFFALRPVSDSMYLVGMPVPGRLPMSIEGSIRAPFCIMTREVTDLRASLRAGISDCSTSFFICPKLSSASRTASTSVRISSGSTPSLWSGLSGRDLSTVKCFSITHAPRITANAGVSGSNVWSEKPIGISGNARCRSSIIRRLESSASVG